MSNIDIIRAWKDEDYRNSLSAEQLSQLPENPAGLVELTNTSMETVVGGSQQKIAGGTIALKPQTVTVTIDICCSTGSLPCIPGYTEDLLCQIKAR